MEGPEGGLVTPVAKRVDDRLLLREILKGVSRSFYLTIRVLPSGMRQPVAVAYLLARAADTIADTRALPPEERLEKLLAFRGLVEGRTNDKSPDGIVAGVSSAHGVSHAEMALLRRVGDVFDLLEGLSEENRAVVRSVVVTLTRGMELDLTTFPAEESGAVAALQSPEELDRYTYLVAGCVGGFWTSVAMAHEARLSRWDRERMGEVGVRFGKALQLTNVLRDVPRDLRNGRCYLPEPELAAEGLSPSDLMEPDNSSRAKRALAPWIRVALEHFDSAEVYLLTTPRRCLRLRLAVLWPILLGLATLEKLAGNEEWLDPDQPSRVKRRWVYGMMGRSLLVAPSDTLLRWWIRGLRRKVEKALDGA